MRKGNFPKLKGNIWNVPIDTVDISNVLLRGSDSNSLVIIKLKRKLTYRGHFYFEAVSTDVPKREKSLYNDVSVDIGNIPDSLLLFANDDIPGPSRTSEDSEEIENPLDVHRFNSQEILLVPSLLTREEISIAPGDRKQPTSILSAAFCEQRAFSCLFPQGKFGYDIERDAKLSPIKYFNQRLLNYT